MENSMTMIHKIPFSELNIWDVKSFFHQADVFRDKHPVVLFGEFLTKSQIEKVKIEDTGVYKILGARSYGKGVFVNRIVKGSTLKMRTYQQAKENHLFWCKVDTKNGAFGIITADLADGVGSTNMAFAKIKTDKANPEYLQILFKSKKVNQYMDGYVSGTTNRKYIKPDQLRDEIRIPLPSILEQNKIIRGFKQKINLAKTQESKVIKLEQEIENYLYSALGIKKIVKSPKRKSFRTIRFKEVDRWAVDSLGRKVKIEENFQGKFPLIKLGALIKSFQYGLSEKSSKEVIGPPMLRMNSIDNSELILNDLKYIKIEEKTFLKYKLNKGDLLFNRTNSKELVGKTAIFNSDEDFTFASYLIRVVINENKANRDYINYLFNSSILQYQKDLVSRQITGQANINSIEMQDFLFPLPDMVIQNKISTHISRLKSEIRDLKSSAKLNRTLAIIEFEKEIFRE